MSVSLSIKDVPEPLAERLRQRAARNHRSLQRELMALIEAAAETPLQAREPEPAYVAAPAAGAGAAGDGLMAELDAVVAGSQWGSAPLLPRDRLHDRALARELDFDCREAELRAARAAGPRETSR
ncbi:MAG: hypothetical protein JSS18_15255 [Proteobacteria bacterium]|nr:hypothetical protein [Pseudomonadota bacterium]